MTPQQSIFFECESNAWYKNKEKHVLCQNLFLPDDATIEEREDEVEGNRTPRDKMVHPRPEMSL